MKSVLFVLTSHEDLGETGQKTGFWLDEFATHYYYLMERGVNISIASPIGGLPPIDPNSLLAGYQTDATNKFNSDETVKMKLDQSQKISEVNQKDYDAIFFSRGLGPMWDLAEDKSSIPLIEGFYLNNKIVSSVCHGSAAFKHAKKPDGSPLVSGIKVMGYSNSEEELIDVASILPFFIENRLRENGGIYSKGENWLPYAVEDGQLVTSQNFTTSELVAKLLLDKLNFK